MENAIVMTDRDIFTNAPVGASREVMETYLDKMCGDDAELRTREEALLEADKEADTNFLEKVPMESNRKALELGLGSASEGATLLDDGRVKVLDFGIATTLPAESDDGSDNTSHEGVIITARPYAAKDASWTPADVLPNGNRRLPRGYPRLRMEIDGRDAVECLTEGALGSDL